MARGQVEIGGNEIFWRVREGGWGTTVLKVLRGARKTFWDVLFKIICINIMARPHNREGMKSFYAFKEWSRKMCSYLRWVVNNFTIMERFNPPTPAIIVDNSLGRLNMLK